MKALVTGGGGFLGKAVVKRLLSRGKSVRVLVRGKYPDLEEAGVAVFRGDVADAATVYNAAKGYDVVFHMAAKIGNWGPYQDYFQTNVVGTENVIAACKAHGISRLIYTSTPSVVHSGGDLEGIDESLPYAEKFTAHYPHTKAIAEKMVLRENSPSLSTIALRPHLIWGPGDTQLLPRAIDKFKSGKLRLCKGPPKRVDTIYIDNAADAHILAHDRLNSNAGCAGKAYFITQGEPISSGELINRILKAAGYGPVEKTISPSLVNLAGWMAEAIYSIFRIKSEPPITRFLAEQLTTSHWYDISAAKRDLGYQPRISLQEGLELLEASFNK